MPINRMSMTLPPCEWINIITIGIKLLLRLAKKPLKFYKGRKEHNGGFNQTGGYRSRRLDEIYRDPIAEIPVADGTASSEAAHQRWSTEQCPLAKQGFYRRDPELS